MAADSEETIKMIEKAIIKLALEGSPSVLELFDTKKFINKNKSLPLKKEGSFLSKLFASTPEDASVSNQKSPQDLMAESVIKIISSKKGEGKKEEDFFKNVMEELKESGELKKSEERLEGLKRVFSNLLNTRRIGVIFERAAEVRLENIAKEEMSEIERLQAFSSFLGDCIVFHPTLASSLSISGENSDEIPFFTIIPRLCEFEKKIKPITNLLAEIREIEAILLGKEEVIRQFEEALKESTEGTEADKRAKTEAMLRGKRAEVEELNLEKEKKIEETKKMDIKGKTLNLLFELTNYLDDILKRYNAENYQCIALRRQVDAVKAKLNDMEATLRAEVMPVEGEKEEKAVEVLLIDKERVLKYLKTLYMETFDMSEENAEVEAQAAFDKAKKESIDPPAALSAALSSYLSSAPPPPPTFAYSLAAVVRASAGSALSRSTARSSADQKKVEAQITKLITSISQVSEQVVQASKEKLNSNAANAAKAAVYPKATKHTLSTRKNIEESETLHVLSTLPNEKELEQLENGYILIGRRRPPTARLFYLQNGELVECDRDNLPLLYQHVSKSLGEPKTRLNLDLKEQKDFIITPCGDDTFFSSRKDLEGSETLYILSVLPGAKQLDQFDNGYILIGPENPGKARLYSLDKDKESKLVECPRGDLTLLCKHVSEFEKIQLNRKEQQELIIAAGSGHDYKTASLAPAPVLPQSQPLSQSRSGSFSASASQNKLDFKGYKMVLLKDGENWPEAIEDKTLYFKWNKPNLTVRHKRENENADKVREYRRPILDPKRMDLISSAFEAREKDELIDGTSKFLREFAERPLSVRPSMQQIPKGTPSSGAKKEEEMKDGSGSPRISLSSNKASFYPPSVQNSSTEEAGANPQITLGMENK